VQWPYNFSLPDIVNHRLHADCTPNAPGS